MVSGSGAIEQGSGQIFRLKIWIVGQNRFGSVAGGKYVEDIAHTYAHAA